MQVPTRAAVAHHEAGHALVGAVSFGNVGQVTIRAEGRALGMAITERFLWTPTRIASMVASGGPTAALAVAKAHQGVRWSLAGHVAEGLHTRAKRVPLYDDDDGREALAFYAAAHPLVGASDAGLGLTAYFLQVEQRRVRAYLRKHWAHVEAIAGALLAHETLDGDGVWAALKDLPHAEFPVYPEDRAARGPKAAGRGGAPRRVSK